MKKITKKFMSSLSYTVFALIHKSPKKHQKNLKNKKMNKKFSSSLKMNVSLRSVYTSHF
jgi:hypothetical protein